MEAKLKQERLSQYSCVYQNSVNREETVESVVPDVLPDIRDILDTQCILLIRSKNSQNGKASVELQLMATVLYTAEEGETIYKLDLIQPVSVTYENDKLRVGDVLHFQIGMNGADTRLLNPRKILLRGDMAVSLSAYRAIEQEITLEPEPDESMEALKKECEIHTIQQAGEKSFGISDEFPLPPTHPGIHTILLAQPTVIIDEMKQVGEKMIVQGTATVKVLSVSEDQTMHSDSYSTIFSQIIDCPENSVGPNTVTILPSGFHVDAEVHGGETVLRMEMYLIAQTLCRTKQSVSYLADAYSVTKYTELEAAALPVCISGELRTFRETIRDVLDTTDEVKEIVHVDLYPSPVLVMDERVETPMIVNVLYYNSQGKLCSVSRKIKAVFPVSNESDIQMHPYPAKWQEPYLQPTGGGIEIRVPMDQTIEIYLNDEIEYVSAIHVADEKNPEYHQGPSLVVAQYDQEDLWPLAKKYHSTVSLIEQANSESLERGELLLIPRPR